jgi:hypothetical protein
MIRVSAAMARKDIEFMNSPVIRPKGLSEVELATLGIWFVAVGRWDLLDFSEAQAEQFVIHFFKCLKDDPEHGLRASYLSLQNTFMAMRRGSFEAIQSEPPFSRFGRRNMKVLLRAWLETDETGFRSAWEKIFGADHRAQLPHEQPIRIIGRSGDSTENAIQVLTDYPDDKINAEYWHLYYEYGQGWRREIQMATVPDAGGRRYDILNIRFPDGEKRQFYFLL